MNFLHILNPFFRQGALFFFLFLCFSVGAKAEQCTEAVATVVSIQGVVEVHSKASSEWKKIMVQETFCIGDRVRTHANSRAALQLNNNSILRLNELSTVTFTDLSPQGESRLDLKKGIVHFISRLKKRFEVVTPFVNAAVDGTEFVVAVNAEQARITVFEGQVRAANEQGEIKLRSGETALARAGEAPHLQARVQPWDAVSWALYYPAVSDFTSLTDAHLAPSLEHYRQGDFSSALAVLESLADDLFDSKSYVYRAALYLTVGQIAAADADLEQALKQEANNGDALALKAVIAVTQNHTDLALELASQAVEASPDTVAPWLAQSYAQQAVFDLEPARLSVEQAVESTPASGLAWARLAELHLMFGELDRALEAARRATELPPDLARSQSVLGFAHLTRIDISAAKQAFNQAIQLDQADPQPRLGLGLALIRSGELVAGRRQIEIAASLAPTNPLIRSYLGKAYYEEKRSPLDATQFSLAKELDPNDPTPYFYSAIMQQTNNRPVAALADLQQSIALNDQRAVYRSRLLLDQDRATRGVSLSRVYSDLGMEQLALVEGWKSVAIDPSNYSAHRFLADSYSTRPRHEIARVSELLQAQLLQPVNINPVQPRLSATYLDPRTSLANATLNEYTPLFERNQVKLLSSGVVGSNDTLGGELTASGIYNRASFSLGRFYSKTDGFRDNNDDKNILYNAFAQFAVTPRLNLQVEYRRRDTQRGDLALRFEPERFDPFVRTDIEQKDIRVGGHFVLSPRSRIVANVTDVERDERFQQPIGLIESDSNRQGYQAELQYLFQSQHYNIVMGLGRYDLDVQNRITADLGDLCLFDPQLCVITTNITQLHDNAYAYINITRPAKVIWTVGLGYDDYEIVDQDRQNRFNPKLGVQWQFNDTVRLRAAGFKTLKRALVANQTIEPTQIAGFNQFFDDDTATTSTRYGLGLDFSLARNINAGLEYTRSDLKEPDLDTNFKIFRYRDRNEHVRRAYLYWTPTKNIALGGEYQYENFDRSDGSVRLSETHIVRLSLRYFSPQGFFCELGVNDVRQNVDRKDELSSLVFNESDAFRLINTTLGYSLPKRRGSISILLRNLLDKDFNYYDINPWVTELVQPRFIPERIFLAQLTLHL
ncbi:FIG00860065: hypothetical protein [hydrothermal vent metagenome]|uniref:FecR protein domain-containing protein n=1 Tax=hydrothermal vent metagenome TaxID=652676 RepID=A0A3B0ZUP0_9ZZZZ